MEINTGRMILQPWTMADLAVFTALHADPVVMADQGGPLNDAQSREKLKRYELAYQQFGYARWRVSLTGRDTIGYCGVMPVRRAHPLGPHEEIGWRLFPQVWGQGYAAEAAAAALADVFARTRIQTVFAYTAADNHRSQRVMHKLGLQRQAQLDFVASDPRLGQWRGLVWKADKSAE